jgi:uncharacterized protein (DUF1501 family)
MTLTRRELIKHLSGLPLLGLAGGATRVLAAPDAGQTRFLLVFLRGAVDAANVLVPTHRSLYYETRPTIAIAKPGTSFKRLLPLLAVPQFKFVALTNQYDALRQRREIAQRR